MQSAALIILREGEDQATFIPRLFLLQNKEPEKYEILNEVCERMQFIEILKYSDFYWSLISPNNPQVLLQVQYQLDRLLSYLTLTCLDAISHDGRKYSEFNNWISNEITNGVNVELSQAITNLRTLPTDRASVLEFPKVIDKYYSRYKKSFGIGRSFKKAVRCFGTTWLHPWLSDIYIINKNINIRKPINMEITWEKITTRNKIKIIADYWIFLRNSYTHSVYYRKPQEIRGLKYLSTANNPDRFNIRLINESNIFISRKIDYAVGLKSNLSESDVLRLFVISYLRNWLNIVDDQTFIKRYLERVDYRSISHQLLHEIRFNHLLLSHWAITPIFAEWSWSHDISSKVLFNTNASDIFLSYPNKSHDTILWHEVYRYCVLVKTINDQLTTFTASIEENRANPSIEQTRLIQLFNENRINWKIPELFNKITSIETLVHLALEDGDY
jgi:hypothetical protein